MLTLVFRKIISNTWKVLCLLLGSILVVGMVCSIPIYTNGILQRLLTKDLEQVLKEQQRYPGYLVFSSNYYYVDKQQSESNLQTMRETYAQTVQDMPLQPVTELESIQVTNLYYTYEDAKGTQRKGFNAYSLSDFPSRIKIDRGRLYEKTEDGVIEVVVTDAAMQRLNLLLDKTYDVHSYRKSRDEPPLFSMRVVGMFSAADLQDLYWYQHINSFSQSVLVDPDVLRQLTYDHPLLSVGEQQLAAAYDFYQFRIQDIDQIQAVHASAQGLVDEHSRTTRLISTFKPVIERYVVRESELKLTLQILIVPILLMLIFYIFMVSQLMVRSETSLISVLESRGAGRSQILLLYALESLIFGIITLIIGPFLGLWMVRIIGASNGFLEFVSRAALKVAIDKQAMIYGVIAMLLFLITTLLPVFIQSRTSIVEQKRRKSRVSRAPLWQRIFLDFILLAVSLYALNRLQAQLALQKLTGIVGTEANLDFLLFLSSTIFILGTGLLFLRLYPLLIRLIYFIGRRFWNPVFYASFHQIGHSSGQEQFLMIFLILALSIGLFNANAARTINRNAEDTIRCGIGADIMLNEYWQKYDENGVPIIEDSGLGMSLDTSTTSSSQVVKYDEPAFAKYQKLDGVASAARVFRSSESRISRGSSRSDEVNLMAIDPYDFARTAWTRKDLFRYHMNEYMNVMITTPNAVIVSENLREELDLKVGDGIIYSVNRTDTVDGVIIAFVSNWPGYQPTVIDRTGQLRQQGLIVANLEFMLSKTAIQPYEIWLKRDTEATDKMIYDAIEDDRINVTNIASATQMITLAKNDPQLQGTNGALTLGFIVSMLICAVGFLIYWIMSVQGRVLQFGIFRAMGLSKAAVIGMIMTEQVLVSGIAILAGVIIGSLSSLLFVPLFQIVYSTADQPIPFRIISETSDANKIYVILGLLLLICFAILARLILRIKIDQAVKLGEE